jgi:histidinol phosphatase-like PHP family hydrolase
MLVDLHCHSTLSDGTLSVAEMVAAAEQRGYHALAITDHVSPGDDHRERAQRVRAEVARFASLTPVQLYAGVEVTEYEPRDIHRIAEEVKAAGAQLVVVHGECLMHFVAPGTNAAAVRSDAVDILAHPGLLSEEDATTASRTGVFLELSGALHHSYANGHVYRVARNANAAVVVDSDAHDAESLLTEQKVNAIVRGAGASASYVQRIVNDMAPALLVRLATQLPVRV